MNFTGIVKKATEFLYYTFAAILLAWTGYRTWHILSLTTDNAIVPFLGLGLFEGGMVAWLLFALFRAEGITQRAVAFGASLLDMVAVIGATASGIYLDSQLLAAIDRQWIGMIVNWIIVVATIINVLAMWVAHVTEPEMIRRMTMRSVQDSILAETQRQLQAATPKIAARAAQIVSKTTLTEAVRQLYEDYGINAAWQASDADLDIAPEAAPTARAAIPAQMTQDNITATISAAIAKALTNPGSHDIRELTAAPARLNGNGDDARGTGGHPT